MPTEDIETLFARIRTWPEDWQAEAAGALLKLEQEFEQQPELSGTDERALDAAAERAGRGEFATNAEVDAFFAKHR
ncbi:MAG: hypothetical protein ACREHE_05610 [Rhizomicrobium sp.]